MVPIISNSPSNLKSSSFDVCTKQSSSMLNLAGDHDNIEVAARHHQQINKFCSSEMPDDAKVVEKTQHLKITLLSLSGITVEKCDSATVMDSDIKPNNFSITASVSFSGSCDPADMHVMSSRLCSLTRLLCVDSNVVVIPDGMNDHLVAVWDDTSSIKYKESWNTSSGDTFGYSKSSGSIPANPRSNPHLHVMLRGENQQLCHTSKTVAESTQMSTLSQDSKSISSSLERSPLIKNDNNIDEAAQSDCDMSSSSHSSGPLFHRRRSDDSAIDEVVSSSQDLDFTILNTPSTDKDMKTYVPEILEMKITLRVEEVAYESCEEDETEAINLVRSTCESTPEGGGAVAHLVLFSDLLHNSATGETGCRIIQIPVRKVFHQVSRSVAHDPNLKLSADQNVAWKRFLQEPVMYVDLDESAMLWVKVESGGNGSNVSLPSPTLRSAAEMEIVKAECLGNPSCFQDTNILSNDAATISSQVAHGNRKDSSDAKSIMLENPVDPPARCNPSLGFESFFKGLSGVMMHCGDDVRAFQLDDASMDSTIGSKYTL